MKNLDADIPMIEDFIQKSIDRFTAEIGVPGAVGIYCCPWSGWLTTHFNTDKTIPESHLNCPDFQFVEFDFLELPDWQEEYEQESPVFEFNGIRFRHDHNLGDENLNGFIFNCLKPVVMNLRHRNKPQFLLQLLDSAFVAVI